MSLTRLFRATATSVCAACLLTGTLFAQAPAAPAVGEDVDVVELTAKTDLGKTTARGYIADYTGSQLKLRTLDGRETSYPSDRVIRISTSRLDEQIAGDASFAAREYRSALMAYEKATQRESRVWVKRELTAQRIWCLRMMGQTSAAVKLFLALEQSDPQTVHYDCIPLLWPVGEAPDDLKAEARTWLNDPQSKAASLIGASFLLATDRSLARAKLEELTKLRHPALPWLAQAQLWRSEIVAARPDDLESWGRLVERMPRSLQAGPSFVVGLGYSHHQRDHDAALWFLRGAYLDNRDRRLTIEALQRSGEAYERGKRRETAAVVYREIVTDYPEYPSAVLAAQGRLAELAKTNSR